MPILVWVLEGLASCRAQLREREEEAEREKREREELLERYQAEKALRRENQEVGRGADLMVLVVCVVSCDGHKTCPPKSE